MRYQHKKEIIIYFRFFFFKTLESTQSSSFDSHNAFNSQKVIYKEKKRIISLCIWYPSKCSPSLKNSMMQVKENARQNIKGKHATHIFNFNVGIF